MEIVLLTSLIVLLLLLEYLHIKILLQSIPIRIHINGTRGKSTTTELIVTLLRSANYKTLGKITGVIPTILLPNGENKVIKRFGEPRLVEQLRMIRLANKMNVKAIALECMSVTPEYQKLETSILQPNIYIITNIKYDHAEQMGNNIEDMVNSICNSIPSNSIVVTCEDNYIYKIKEIAEKRNSTVTTVKSENIFKEVYFSHGVHPSSIAIALKIGEIIGLDKNYSFYQLTKHMRNYKSLLKKIQINDKIIYFINGFSINDVSSAHECLKTWQERTGIFSDINIILNTRNDRPLRTLEFIKWILKLEAIDKVFLSGSHKYFAKYKLINKHFNKSKIVLLTNHLLKNDDKFIQLFQKENQLVFGVGNIKNAGFKIIEIFQKLAS